MEAIFVRFAYGEVEWVDAFSIYSRKGKGYFLPPVGCIASVLRYAEVCRAIRFMYVLDWPGIFLCWW